MALAGGGYGAYEAFWQPLLEGKFGDYYQQVNMAWFWARLAARTPNLGYFVGGFQAFLDALADKVRAQGGQILLEHHVRGVYPEADGRIRLELRDGDRLHDCVLATCSPAMLKERTPALPASYAAGLDDLKSMGAVGMVLAGKQQVSDGHYWINIPNGRVPLTGFSWRHQLHDKQHYGGDTIAYCGGYLPADHPYFAWSRRASGVYLRGFSGHPAFDRSWIGRSGSSPRRTQPVPLVDLRSFPPLETPFPITTWRP
jgi:protoporphyrinogen oxidase